MPLGIGDDKKRKGARGAENGKEGRADRMPTHLWKPLAILTVPIHAPVKGWEIGLFHPCHTRMKKSVDPLSSIKTTVPPSRPCCGHVYMYEIIICCSGR